MFKPAAAIVAAVLALTSMPTALAGSDCSIVGWINDNTIWSGPGGPTVAGSQGAKIYKDGKEIWKWEQGDFDSGLCSDYKGFTADGLAEFGWAASCGDGQFKECHGSYLSQTHIEGEDPSNSGDFYGIGVTSSTECKMNFSC